MRSVQAGCSGLHPLAALNAVVSSFCRMGPRGHRRQKWKQGPYLDGRDRNTTWVKVLNPDYAQRVAATNRSIRRYAAESGA